MRKIIHVPDLKCDGCVTHLENNLRSIEGVDDVFGDFDSREIVVEYSEELITLDKIKDIIRAVGYTPGKVSNGPPE